jgi:hypothetical protein
MLSDGVADRFAFAHDARSRDWGVVQLVGRCTVNADGGGSNPPAPANSEIRDSGEGVRVLIFDDGET